MLCHVAYLCLALAYSIVDVVCLCMRVVFLLWSLGKNSSLDGTSLYPVKEDNVGVVRVKKGRFLPMMKKAEKKRATLLAYLGDLNRPLRVRPVNVMGRDWWAVDGEDTWPGMVMDLRRLGYESIAWGEEVLVREGMPAYDPQMDSPVGQEGLKPFPLIHPTIQIRRESYSTDIPEVSHLDEYGDDEEIEEDEIAPDEDLQYE